MRPAISPLINDIVIACKAIANAVSRGSLAGVCSATPAPRTCRGEDQKKLDVLANEAFLRCKRMGRARAAMASEEMDDVYNLPAVVSARPLPCCSIRSTAPRTPT